MTEIEPPSDALRDLFASERDISAVERAAIKQKLAATLAPPAPVAAVSTKMVVWIAAAAVATAVGIWWFARGDEPKPVLQTPALEAPTPVHTEQPNVAPAAPVAPAPAPVTPSVATPVEHPPAKPATPSPAASQTELLAKAWQALASNPDETLRLVELDQRLHARGALTEEREALRIQALSAVNRRDEARELGRRFLVRYPSSVHTQQVRHVLEAP